MDKCVTVDISDKCFEQGHFHFDAAVNVITAAGRLSFRRDNMRNHPAPENYRYKVRKEFVSDKTNSLNVADGGQLQLRLLPQMTKRKEMIDTIRAGGEVHSLTGLKTFRMLQMRLARG